MSGKRLIISGVWRNRKGVKMYCKKCGTENSNEAKFCKECGAVLEQDTSEPSEKEEASAVKKKRTKLWAAIGIVIVLVAVAAGVFLSTKIMKEKTTISQDYQDYISQAEKYLEELDYENAEDSYLKAIEIDPKQEEPYLKLVDIYLVQEEFDKAIEILEQAEAAVNTESASNNEGQEIQSRTNFNEIKEEITNIIDYTWILEPSIEADDIYYVALTDDFEYSFNERCRQFESPYAVIRQGDALGLIDMDGELLGGLDYKKIENSVNTYKVTRTVPQYSEEYECDWEMYALDNNGEFQEAFGRGESLEVAYYYDTESMNLLTYDDIGEIDIPEITIPVASTSSVYGNTMTEGRSRPVWNQNHEKFAIYCQNKLTTDFIYEQCGSLSNGLMAVCEDGKWGYVDKDGKSIIPTEYDASWHYFEPCLYGYTLDRLDYCYAASDGYVTLCKDNKWELRDVEGNLVLPAGIFEEICPVYEGKCWVKKEGKWGVIQLESENQAKQVENEDTNEITSETYQSVYSPILQEVTNKYSEYSISNIYYIYDIDKDGIKELLVREGTCEADYMYQVYTIENSDNKYTDKYLGEISGFHCTFYADENGGTEKYIIRSEGITGYGQVSYISIENGQVIEQEVSSNNNYEYYSNDYPIPYASTTDLSLLR